LFGGTFRVNRKTCLRIALVAIVLGAAACGDSDNSADESDIETTTTAVADSTVPTSEPESSTPDDSSMEAGNATVTFEEDGTTLEFALDECYTHNNAPDNFVNVGPEGAFASHGVRDDGWELQLSLIPDANGEMVNFSFLTDGSETDYELGNLTFEVDGSTVAASATSDIFQTLGTEEAVPLSFAVTCSG
jgi:hypothetical protein